MFVGIWNFHQVWSCFKLFTFILLRNLLVKLRWMQYFYPLLVSLVLDYVFGLLGSQWYTFWYVMSLLLRNYLSDTYYRLQCQWYKDYLLFGSWACGSSEQFVFLHAVMFGAVILNGVVWMKDSLSNVFEHGKFFVIQSCFCSVQPCKP